MSTQGEFCVNTKVSEMNGSDCAVALPLARACLRVCSGYPRTSRVKAHSLFGWLACG